MGQVLLVLAAVGVAIYAAIDCFGSAETEVRGLPKPLWLLVILVVPVAGPLGWLLLGRAGVPGPRRMRTIGPDDDLDFLRTLDPPPPRRRDDEPPAGS
jgi:uncharacterized RDD family membrane protein YckC